MSEAKYRGWTFSEWSARLKQVGISHYVPDACGQERCVFNDDQGSCNEAASHKVEDSYSQAAKHPLTAYLCCSHFKQVMGRCQR